MELIAKLTAVVLYPAVLAARLANGVMGRDPLRLKEPAGTCWVERRAPAPRRRSYFSEASEAEGGGNDEHGGLALSVLTWASRRFRPVSRNPILDRQAPGAKAGDEIPDEVYTLW